jgi:plastocyanin
MKRMLLLASLAFASAAPAAGPAPGGGGTVRGTIRVIASGTAVAHDDVYVYLVPAGRHRRGTLPGAGRSIEIRQQNKEFVPHVVVVPTGTTVYFPNYDSEEHNVFSPTTPPGQFDLGRYSTDHKGHARELDDAAEIDIFCDIHKQMWAKVKVVDTPYIAAAGKTGEFAFEHVEPGTYKIVGWLPNNKEETRSIEKIVVTEGATTKLADELHLQLDLLELKPHTRKDGTQYPVYKP